MVPEDLSDIELSKAFDDHFKLFLPLNCLNYTFDSHTDRAIREEIRNFYFGDKAVSKETLAEYVKMTDDVFFVYGIDQSVKAQANRSTGRTYYYQ